LGCGAASLSKDVEEQVEARFKGNVNIRQGYGMSETTYGIIQQIGLKKPGSVGQAMKNVFIKVVDENGKSLGPDQKGELCFKGPAVMKGYVGDEKATKETIDEDGWLHSGDIGYYDEDEQFFIVDRIKELIKYNAFQVPPAEIEGLLLSHPKIDDVAVIGVPDKITGEKAMAFVVRKPGAKVTEKEIIEFVAENASKPKQLHGGVQFVGEIPKTVSGKILRRVLRDRALKIKAKL
jgi:4-coumarate--CoA ligase